ncbi:hypothetical protein EYD45_05860 [Hyunsoonleella flava]|uniref:Uncharacterized protein n=1 Tax=Hyunsoonleella flava TaxID=2527939 RepID=A0A4V2JA92_9FLAO|nr:hypothetical protein [Hyunsoonleella flava]TBN04784.1 hypothetical protein EYD45_05860 [Hyunsoonleella flava]
MKRNKLDNINASGFKVPKDYFENFEYTLMDNIKVEEVIGTPETGFDVPKHYFETLEDRIVANVAEKKDTKVISLLNRKTIVYISGIAAAILLLFNLSIFNDRVSIEDLEAATVENYILDEDISSYEIASLFTEELPSEDGLVEYNLDAENLEEYLLNNADIESYMVE